MSSFSDAVSRTVPATVLVPGPGARRGFFKKGARETGERRKRAGRRRGGGGGVSRIRGGMDNITEVDIIALWSQQTANDALPAHRTTNTKATIGRTAAVFKINR